MAELPQNQIYISKVKLLIEVHSSFSNYKDSHRILHLLDIIALQPSNVFIVHFISELHQVYALIIILLAFAHFHQRSTFHLKNIFR